MTRTPSPRLDARRTDRAAGVLPGAAVASVTGALLGAAHGVRAVPAGPRAAMNSPESWTPCPRPHRAVYGWKYSDMPLGRGRCPGDAVGPPRGCREGPCAGQKECRVTAP